MSDKVCTCDYGTENLICAAHPPAREQASTPVIPSQAERESLPAWKLNRYITQLEAERDTWKAKHEWFVKLERDSRTQRDTAYGLLREHQYNETGCCVDCGALQGTPCGTDSDGPCRIDALLSPEEHQEER